MRKTQHMKKFGIGALSLLLIASILPTSKCADTIKAAEDATIESPVLDNTITWDCVYFGSYPQSEVTVDTDPITYYNLQSSNNWDSNETLILNDTKYKRIQKEDAISTGASYNWSDDNTYHYFKFEPIKWRVINVTMNTAYMVSDIALDTQKYNQEARGVSWDTSSLRSWLNGYNASSNQSEIDYSSNNFLDTAFNSSEQNIIVSTNSDKVTILSEADMKDSVAYGFYEQDSRICKASAYAQAMGSHQDMFGACNWWTNTSGNSNLTTKYIQQSGEIYTKGYSIAYAGISVRTAVTINLNQTDVYRYAGTVSSDGTVIDTVPTTAPTITPTVTPSITQMIETEAPILPTLPTVSSTLVPTQTPIATMAPTLVPTQTPIATMAPTLVPTQTATATTAPTSVSTQTPIATTTVPTQTATIATTAPTTNSISKNSVWYHTASNAQYRIIKINKTASADGTVGTVAYLSPIKTNKTSARIPATVTIENQKFKVTTIANGAFAGNKKLKQVVIGKNIKKIRARAFKGCQKLSKITIRTTGLTKTSIGKNAFKKIKAKATIQVPKAKLKKYKKFIRAAGAAKTVVFKKIGSK